MGPFKRSFRLRKAVLAVAAAAMFCGREPADSPAARPNVVILCIDTLRADHVSAYGYSRKTTPFIDRLAQEGVLFQTTYAHSNWTVPSTATLLTSRLPSEHGAGIAGNVRLLGDQTEILQIRDGVDTLATILKRAGFKTGLFSANPFLFGRFKAGFDRAEVSRRPAAELTSMATSWLDEQPHDDPFFLYVQYMDLHHPIEPPQPFFDYFKVAEGGTRGPEHTSWQFGQIRNQRDLDGPAFRQWSAHHIALYDGALLYIDSAIRRLCQHLEATGRLKDTVIVVTSDHGEEFWDHAIDEQADGNNPRPYWGVGHGHTMYEELLRVPMIVHGPAVAQNRMVPCTARLIDVVPTLLDFLGIARNAAMRGQSLRPFLAPRAGPEICKPATAIVESPAYGPDSWAVIFNRRKLITRSDGVELAFDLRDDPAEHHNLAGSHPELVKALRAILDRERTHANIRQPAIGMTIDEETKRQLRSLGYLN